MAALLVLLLFAAGDAAADPRIELVELQHQERHAEALRRLRALREAPPATAHDAELVYLRGHLLARLGRPRDAIAAWAEVMRRSPDLRPYALWRIAEQQVALEHPELAAGLVVSLLSGSPPAWLVPAAEKLLTRALADGADCRLLERMQLEELPETSRRRLQLARVECRAERGAVPVTEGLLALLRESTVDLAASLAASRLARSEDLAPEAASLVGRTLHDHREFEAAARLLEAAASQLPERLERSQDVETYYSLVRSWFWNGQLRRAAAGFGELARRAERRADRARAYYQRARSFELDGAWGQAASDYRRAYLEHPAGRFAGASLIAALRLEWRSGQEASAREILDVLASSSRWREEAGRAVLFLASSDIVRGRSERAGSWLRQARGWLGRSSIEVTFWRGRLAELADDPEAAVALFLEAVRADPYHPLAFAAVGRLRQPPLGSESRSAAARLGASDRLQDLDLAWRITPEGDPSRIDAWRRMLERAAAQRSRELELAPVDPRDWPLWEREPSSPEERFLALGLWEEGSSVALSHFPMSEPALALTAALALARAGQLRRSLWVAEILSQRLPPSVPAPVWPQHLQRALYPLAFREAVLHAATRQSLEPHLLLALLRQESRFDPEVVSSASARGLGQLTLPTARRVAQDLGLGPVSPADLLRPEVSIELAASHLAGLLEHFDGRHWEAVAAYNAGEGQTRLWRSHCWSRDPEEFYTKVSFGETRAYLDHVLGARARYREIYAQIDDPRRAVAPSIQGGRPD